MVNNYKEQLVSSVNYIFEYAKELQKYKDNDLLFINRIKELDKNYLRKVADEYKDKEKIGKIRYEFVSRILENDDVSIETLEKIKTDITSQYDTNILQSWVNFSILFPIYYNAQKGKIRTELNIISKELKNIVDEIGGDSNDLDESINDFLWRQNFGSTDCWIALYPKEKENHKNAAQIFMIIYPDHIMYGLDYGSNTGIPNEQRILESVNSIEDFTHEKVKDQIKSIYSTFISFNNDGGDIVVNPVDDNYDKTTNYFWITSNPTIWSVDKIKNGGNVFYTAYNIKGNKRRIFSSFEKVKKGDKVLFYESTPRKEIVAIGEIVEGLHKEQEEGYENPVDGITIKYIEDIIPISWTQLVEIEDLKECSPIKNVAQGSLFELTKEEYDTILSLERVEEDIVSLEIPKVSFEKEIKLKNLIMQDKLIIKQIETALKTGKHIILVGPPGTGKSKLAKEICNSFGVDYIMTTASSDWSTFDTIGGYKPDLDGNLYFNEGTFLSCFKDNKTNHPKNKWLIIDEINRADIDKAFGSLFSALTGDTITLSFKSKNGNNIIVKPQKNLEHILPNDYEYIIPNDFRIIATMNTFDKASLYEMSYAFMRRFAFIYVGTPKNINQALITKYLDLWKINYNSSLEILSQVWITINKYREIGPAIIEDIARYVSIDDDYTSAIILYVLPQFEGLSENEIKAFIEKISELEAVDRARLQAVADDFFGIKEF